MTQDLEIFLRDKYKDLSYSHSGCNDSWFTIIDSALHCIQHHLNYVKPEFRNDFSLTQIKSKFAGLRIYVSITDDYIDGIISMAFTMSMKTCEKCGSTKNTEQIRVGNWLWTLCETCKNKANEEK